MDEIIKIVRLPPFRVVSFHVKDSKIPEEEAWTKLEAWAKPKGMFDDPAKHQIFGFNNPIPMGESELRGYEFWITIPDNFPVKDATVKRYPGGIYAVTTCRSVNNIGTAWSKLYEWLKSGETFKLAYPEDYDFENGPALELEHHLNPRVMDVNEIVLDCYMPICEK
ncbi:MAG: GyrI-like domain-containing protein [Halobacteriota archaeon]|nr:GyrI-like domain-containing protein [Halobacteriota archaeon]